MTMSWETDLQEDVLNLMPDFHRLSKKFHRKTATLDDVVRIFQAIKKVSDVVMETATLLLLHSDL